MRKQFTNKYIFLVVAIMFGIVMAGSVVIDRSLVSANEQNLTTSLVNVNK